MILRLSATAAVAALLVSGCAASSAEEPAASGEQDLTAPAYYDCRSSFSDEQLARFEIAITDRTLDVVDLSKDAVEPDTGSIDPSYRPGSSYAGYVRYSGYAKISKGFASYTTIDMLASKELQARAPKAQLAIRSQASDGGGTNRATCTAKAKKLAVDPARKARLNCSLGQSICTDGNPPGSTCLFDMFVNQTSPSAATLKLTYLDHFGVHVSERPVSIGASTSLARTETHAEASWADGTGVSLDLRGGITYTGTYTDKSGEKRPLQCNDLAMLDD